MGHALVSASIDRAGDHAVVLGVIAVIAAVGWLVYRFALKGRGGRTRSDGDPDGGPDG